ncbi:hypothetical protein D1872_257840 [compost metagenome]
MIGSVACYSVSGIGSPVRCGDGNHLHIRIFRNKLTADDIDMPQKVFMQIHVFIRINDCGTMRTVILNADFRFGTFPMQLVRHAGQEGMSQTVRIRQDNRSVRILPAAAA